MLAETMANLGRQSSVIREIFEYGKQRKAQIGADRVFDFSIGNPSVPAPAIVNDTLTRLLREEDSVALHGYTSAVGDFSTREAIAAYLNRTYQTTFSAAQFYMTAGAAASLSITFHALTEPEDEYILFAPFFPEYAVFIREAGGTPVIVCCRESDFQIDFDAFSRALTPHTKAVVINSPNNPSGVVLSAETLSRLATVLTDAATRFGHPIFLISDEPYRELVYDGVTVPYPTHFYPDTIVCYSFSKSLSLPGERIGYILVSPAATRWEDIYAAVCGAGRALGYVCAPSLFQKLIPACLGQTADLSVYAHNRDRLCGVLTESGYTVARPDGAFYLFVKALEPDAGRFCERAKTHELLLVPSDSFGYPGYVRIAYCVSPEQIERSLPAFRALAEEYRHG